MKFKFSKIGHLLSLTKYINSFKSNFGKCTVKEIDFKNKKIAIYMRGTRNIVDFNIFDIFYDASLISSISSLDSFAVGYCCGINFSLFSKTSEKSFDYSLEPHSEKYRCTIISIDRKKNIVFNYISQNYVKEFNMHPMDIANQKGLIKNFSPNQACYLGLLAGCSKK